MRRRSRYQVLLEARVIQEVVVHHTRQLVSTCLPSSPIVINTALAKPDVYHIDTTNVLFILSGAFVGLDTVIKQRVAKGVSDGPAVCCGC